MTNYELDFSEFGYMEIENTISLLQTYLKLKYSGDSKIWLNRVVWNNDNANVYLIDDNDKKFSEYSLKKRIE